MKEKPTRISPLMVGPKEGTAPEPAPGGVVVGHAAVRATTIEQWEKYGIPCHYVRFHQPIPPAENAEPVSEFKLNSHGKYSVESIVYTEHGVIWRAKGEVDICALANVMYARSIQLK